MCLGILLCRDSVEGDQRESYPNLAADHCGLILAALFAAGHDGGVQAFAEAGREVVNFVRAIDFNGLAGGVEGDLAVVAASEV